MQYNINHDEILSKKEEPNFDVRIKSKLSQIYYCKWKLSLHLNSDVYEIFKKANELLEQTFYPLGKSTDVLPYIDRICYRLPDIIRKEGGLALHLDRRPQTEINDVKCFENIKKYRPIQGFMALTDHFGNSSGGLQVVKGFIMNF